jgi:hypothetical protein
MIMTPYTNERGNRVYLMAGETGRGDRIWFEGERWESGGWSGDSSINWPSFGEARQALKNKYAGTD